MNRGLMIVARAVGKNLYSAATTNATKDELRTLFAKQLLEEQLKEIRRRT